MFQVNDRFTTEVHAVMMGAMLAPREEFASVEPPADSPAWQDAPVEQVIANYGVTPSMAR